MDLLLAVLAGFTVAAVTTPVGISGAVLLLPVQLSALGMHGPAVSATNLLYNVVATPLGLRRLVRAARGHGAEMAVAAAVPCSIVGAAVRVTWLSDPDLFRALLAVLMFGMGLRLLIVRSRKRPEPAPNAPARERGVLALAAGGAALFGAAVGIGGGSLLAPLLVGVGGWLTSRAAVVALSTTLTTSVAGLTAYAVFDLVGFGAAPAAPDWGVGLALGVGGMAGSLVGIGLSRRLGEQPLRFLLGGLILLTGASYLVGLVR
ncbi:sulfite exporter TauE/SafE family protein [Nocardiopsis alba]|uniref:sulfite exporter TauE/SafE family protein n=1 Tax=Nocardiopsis alba TaxID=53437 RepID=UPI0005A644C1|nr:sulfite exporter TauE/SafE family protein [Nocardiopsis alba]